MFENLGRKSNTGRKPIDPVFLFKVLFLQRLYGMSQAQIVYPIKDRTCFRDFRGIQSVDEVPDEKTVWKYKEALAWNGMYDSLFKRFSEYLDSIGRIVNEGKMVDASFVIAPRQRNTREENKKIKEGKGDELWNGNPHKKCHKDIDARWVKKRGERFYGYKDNVEICNKTLFIRNYMVCSASRHDSKETEQVLMEPPREAMGNPHGLTLGGLIFKGGGIIRAKANIALTNLVYNMCRLVQIKKYQPYLTTIQRAEFQIITHACKIHL